MKMTDRRRRILAAIASHRGPGSPSTTEIAAAAGLRSTSSVQFQLGALLRGGWIVRDPHRPRTVHLADGVFVARSFALVEHCPSCEMTLPTDHLCESDLRVSLHEVAARVEPAGSLDDLRARLNNTPREDHPMTTPRDGVPVIPGQTAVELPVRDASEVMGPGEEAALVEVIEGGHDPAAYVEATRPDGVIVLEQPTVRKIPVSGNGFLKVLTGADVELELTDSDGFEHGMFLTSADARQLAGLLVLAAAEIDADSP